MKAEAAQAVAARASDRRSGSLRVPGMLDIRDPAAVDRVFVDVQARLGSLDIVICTPSINVRKPILQYTSDELERVLDLNIKGNFNVLQAAGRIMTAQRRGSIVLFSSIRSQVVEPGQARLRRDQSRHPADGAHGRGRVRPLRRPRQRRGPGRHRDAR